MSHRGLRPGLLLAAAAEFPSRVTGRSEEDSCSLVACELTVGRHRAEWEGAGGLTSGVAILLPTDTRTTFKWGAERPDLESKLIFVMTFKYLYLPSDAILYFCKTTKFLTLP